MGQIMVDRENAKVLDNDIQADLIRRWKAEGDIEARNKVILANQKMVLKIARKRTQMSDRLHFDEVAQNLFAKLPAIIDRFDPEHGAKFSVFLWRNLDGYSLHCVNDKWNGRLSLDANTTRTSDDNKTTWLDRTEDDRPTAEESIILGDAVEALRDAVKELTEIERKVLTGRFDLDGNGKRTLQDLGDELGRTKAGVLAIENRGLARLKTMIDC